MENDQRLTPLPGGRAIQPNTHIDYSSGGTYAATYEDTLDNRRSLRQYFQVVYKRLPIILAITLLVTVAAAIYSYRQPSQYQTTTGIIIEPRKPSQAKKEAVTINLGDDDRYYRTQLELLKSPDLMKRVVVDLGLHRDPSLFGDQSRGILASVRSLFSGEKKSVENPNTVPVISDTTATAGDKVTVALTPEEDARATAYAGQFGVNVTPRGQTNIVDVSVSSTRQDLLPKVADKIAELFIAENAAREMQSNTQALAELEESIAGLRVSIDRQQNEYIAEMRANFLGMGDEQGKLRAGNLEGLLESWRKAQEETGIIEAKYNAVLRARDKGDIGAVLPDNPTISMYRNNELKRLDEHKKRVEELEDKIGQAEERRKELLATRTEQHRDVLAVSERITELRRQREELDKVVGEKIKGDAKALIKNSESEAVKSVESQLTAARQREARQKAAFDTAASQANLEGIATTRLQTLQRALAANQTLLDSYTQRQKELELTIEIERPNNITQQAPAPAAWLTGPARGRNIMVALLLSFAAGIGLAFLLDFLDDSVRTSDDISRHLGLPTLALIPHSDNTDKRKQLLSKGGAAAGAASQSLITMDERTSPMAEAYRHLRTSLLFSSAGKPPQTILVTSSQPAEGKTTTAINTAITLAQGDADVVIIDCDLRRPRLHSHFRMENTRGLTNYLSGDRDTEGLIKTYPDQPRLKVITSGPIPPNPAELLSSNEMRNLLTFLTGKFKHVIIDSPPAISFTDASILSTLVDGVVLVALANKSSLHLMKQFKHRVSAIGARIYGVVLNGIKANSTEYYYYGSGYYNYYSKSADDESTPYLEDVESQNREG
jgi:capsular exopolysaccharide synthesis family protein